MARVLKAYTFAVDRPTGKRGRPPLYPWDEWTDGRIWKVTEGIDFTTSRNGFRSCLAGHAKRKGYTLKAENTNRSSGTKSVVFQFLPKDTKPTPKRTKSQTRRPRKAASNG